MNTNFMSRWTLLSGVSVLCLTALGCVWDSPAPESASGQAKQAEKAAPAKKVVIGKNVTLEIAGDKRRVLIDAAVCQRQVGLEQLLCKKRSKEHESVLAADVDARDIHTALLAAGAEAGSPVKFRDGKIVPPRGTVIKVSLRYTEQGKEVTVPAQQWVRSAKTKKPMEYDWVFAGSYFIPDPLDKTKPPLYAANDGDVICVANMEGAMIDLPVVSSQAENDLAFEANTDRIPALETPVVVILEPVPPAKKQDNPPKK